VRDQLAADTSQIAILCTRHAVTCANRRQGPNLTRPADAKLCWLVPTSHDTHAGAPPPQTLLQQLLEGTILSTITCGTCAASTETRQPVWVMTLPLPPDPPEPPPGASLGTSLRQSSSGKLDGKHASKRSASKGAKSVDSSEAGDGKKLGRKEAKALGKAEKRKERKREKQRRDAGSEPEDLSDGDLSGALQCRERRCRPHARAPSGACTRQVGLQLRTRAAIYQSRQKWLF
jgi:hypothetical protein